MLDIQPKLKIYGVEPSNHANKFIDKKIKKNILKQKAQKKLPFKNKFFDLVISLATFHNLEVFDLTKAIKEIERVGKKYIMLESYQNEKELFNLQCKRLLVKRFFLKNNGFSFIIILIYR